jgi:acyl carrier protein
LASIPLKAERFKLGRSPQDDLAIVVVCGYEAGSDDASVALTIRRVIGECGAVEPQFIHAEDRWPEDLRGLAFWDSIDLLHFVFSVERAAGIRFERDDELASYFYGGFTVAGLVRRVVPGLEERAGSKEDMHL